VIGAGSPFLPAARPSARWSFVARRFAAFVDNLAVTDAQWRDGFRKQAGVRACLNRHYYGHGSEDLNSMLTGSWGKELRVRPPRDIDVLFTLPWTVYDRFQQRLGNRQSQLLQEVRSVLGATYSESEMRGDGQVVVVRFASMPVEVVPAFALDNGQFLICDTTGGGSYRLTDPWMEIVALNESDRINGGATRRLIRMAKQWQRHCAVPLKSFLIERLAIEFLRTWKYSRDYHDWMVCDFFGFMAAVAGRAVVMPGTSSIVPLGSEWAAKARRAQAAANRACAHEKFDNNVQAGIEWQSIFGPMIPLVA
jgi:hypothetical protein